MNTVLYEFCIFRTTFTKEEEFKDTKGVYKGYGQKLHGVLEHRRVFNHYGATSGAATAYPSGKPGFTPGF
jgi:hypothetical protein